MRRYPRIAILVLLGVGGLVIGCSPAEVPEPSPEPTNPTPAVYDGPTSPDLEITEVDLPDDLDIAAVDAAWRLDGLLVLRGADGDDYTAAAAVDTDTGERIWHTADDELDEVETDAGTMRLYGTGYDVVALPDEHTVISKTYLPACSGDTPICRDGQTRTTSGFGVVALDARSLEAVWYNELMPPVDRADPKAELRDDASVVVTPHSDAVLTYSIGDASVRFADNPSTLEFTAVGLNAATGDELWRLPRVLTKVVTDDYLLTDGYASGSAPDLQIRDPRTGDVVRTIDGVDGRWISAAGEVGLVAVPHPETGTRTAAVLVDLATGDVLSDELTSWSSNGPVPASFDDVRLGVQDGREYAAWPSGDGYLSETGRSRWVVNSQSADSEESEEGAEPLSGQSFPQRAEDGYIWLKVPTDASTGYTLAAHDRTGERRTDPLSVDNGFVFDGVIVDQQILGGDGARDVRLWTYDLPGAGG